MGRLAKSNIEPVSGAQLRVFAFREDEAGVTGDPAKMVGRGFSFNSDDQFPAYPAEEIGVDVIDEYIYGQHRGSFTLGKFLGFNAAAEQYLPNADRNRPSFQELEALSFIRLVATGKYKGEWFDRFIGCKCIGRGDGQSPRGLLQGQTRWVYSYHERNPKFEPNSETIIEELPVASE